MKITPRKRVFSLCILSGLFLLSAGVACLPTRTPLPPLPTYTPPEPTETATPTIVWFPPTATYTPLPAVAAQLTATLDQGPSYGALLFQDNFAGQDGWTTGQLPAGRLAFGLNELTLAVSQPRGYLYSLRHGTSLGNFYLEITASPSLCRATDEYGLLLRLASLEDFLRFGVLCNGQVRLDRLAGGQATAPVPPTAAGVIPPGAPNQVRLGVWANGRELHFYANHQHLFSVRESSLLSGSLGVYARTYTSEAMTVNFSDLAVYAAAP